MYDLNLRSAAHRHLQAGEYLIGSHRKDIAGYLLGLAAECTLKKMMQNSGMKELAPEYRKSDPYFAHFETLKTLLKDQANGRLAGELHRYASNPRFMQFWHISMRYSHGRKISDNWVDRWHEDAKNIVAAMDN